MDDDASIREVFAQVTAGAPNFTRRMAITMADMFGAGPLTMVARLERMGLVREGSVDWFKSNGGITREHVETVRRAATPA